MKYDREEAYLHEKLIGGLHPAGVDLWPAVAEHLPDAPPARHPRWKLAICLAAPLLIAAGVLAGTAEFTNLRENPRPSFAPEANTGYAITYERQYFALDEDLLAGMVANHNGEMSDDGWLPMNAKINGQLHPTSLDMLRATKRAAAYPTPEPLEQDPGISEELRAALNTLAPLDRALILERVLDGLDYAALACIHGRPAAYLRTRYHRAKKQLAQRLKEGEHYEV